VARANACKYAESEALADLRRAGLDEAALAALAGPWERLPASDRAALQFARRLTLESPAVTDEEVADLIWSFGERNTVALVQHIAYANFQDRLLSALGLARQLETPPPAVEFRFARAPFGARLAQPRSEPQRVAALLPALLKPDAQWLAADLETLRKNVELQKARHPRITLSGDHDTVVHWGDVCRRYQPELARAWVYCMWTFGAEAYQDPVLEASVLWVVTRTQRSFY
jgi:hypothetical protein